MARDLFLTGASGDLGRHLEPKLSARQSLDRPGGDLLDPRTYAAKLAQCDTVVHLAAVTGKAAADSYFRVNREGTRILVEEARRAGVRNFL
ncbi:MAG: NAD-dependent epimerase/dehydratase family protein, partial [Acidobacteria bacterium]|nr:NAD-dependent epimerase/dehydratase family protein [Acidobacteriota bacterium]